MLRLQQRALVRRQPDRSTEVSVVRCPAGAALPRMAGTIAANPSELARDRGRTKREVGAAHALGECDAAVLPNGIQASSAQRTGPREQDADRRIAPLLRERTKEGVDGARIRRRTRR